MARKNLRNSRNVKIPKAVIFITLGFIALLTAIIIAVQPSASEKFFKRYETAGANAGIETSEQLTRNNHFRQLNHLDNYGLFGWNKGLVNKIKSDDLIIVFFANTADQNSVSSIAQVNFQFSQSDLTEFTNVIYHFTTVSYTDENSPKNNMRTIVTRLIDEFEIIYDLQPKTYSIPLLIAFKDGKFVHATTPGATLTAGDAKQFYSTVHNKITK